MDRILKAQIFFHVYYSDCVRTLKAEILDLLIVGQEGEWSCL